VSQDVGNRTSLMLPPGSGQGKKYKSLVSPEKSPGKPSRSSTPRKAVYVPCTQHADIHHFHLKLLLRAVPGKKVLGGGTELENGGTTNTILSFFYGTIHMDIPGNTPHPPYFN